MNRGPVGPSNADAAARYRPGTGLPSIDAARHTRRQTFRLLLPPGSGFGAAEQIAPEPDGRGTQAYVEPNADHALIFVLHGQDKTWNARIDGRPFRMAVLADAILFAPAGTGSEWYTASGTSRFLHMSIEPGWFARLAEEADEPVPDQVSAFAAGTADPRVVRTLRLLHRGLVEDGAPDRLLTDQARLAIGHGLLGFLGGARRERSRPYALAPVRTARVKAWIEENLDRGISLDDIAAVARLSRFHFVRAFREETGMSPYRWLTHRRCERAKRLMVETNLSLADVAVACGFAHQAHFTNAFHRTVGTTPGRWRTGAV